MKFALLLDGIDDPKVQENLRRVSDFLRECPLLKGDFSFYELSLSAPTYPATVRYPHSLGYVPKDVLVTSSTGGTVTWNYASFTRTHLSVTISAAATVRCFLGSYAEGRTA